MKPGSPTGTLPKNLTYLMRMHGNLTVSELAEQTHIPQPTLHHILFGVTKNPRRKALAALAEFFSISIPQLMGESSLPKILPGQIEENLKIKLIPIISWEIAKDWPRKSNTSSERTILIDKDVSKDSFAIVVDNSSYEPIFPKGAVLIFDPHKKLKNNDYILVHIFASDKVTFNKIFIDGKDLYIKIDEEDGDARLIKLKPNKDRIIAAIVEARLQFDME